MDGTDTDLLLALDLLDMPLRPARLRVDDDLQEEFEQRALVGRGRAEPRLRAGRLMTS